MAVLEVVELYNRSASKNEKWQRTYSRKFQALTDDPTDGPVTVVDAFVSVYSIDIGTKYNAGGTELDEGAYCNSIATDCNSQDGLQWEITVQYGPFDPTKDGEATSNPTEKVPEVSWDSVQFERVVDEDINGEAIVNTAFDGFDPPIIIDDSRPVLKIQRNEALETFSPAVAYAYRDHVNEFEWYGGDPKTWKIAGITAKREFHAEIGFYWNVSYEFHYNPATWTKRILNQGMRELHSGSPRAIKDADGTPISVPALLADDGTKLSAGGDPVWIEFEVYEATDFGVFNLEAT